MSLKGENFAQTLLYTICSLVDQKEQNKLTIEQFHQE